MTFYMPTATGSAGMVKLEDGSTLVTCTFMGRWQ